ncbi:MAG: acyl-CoA dehydrogenase [Pseudonocardiaceae bacterium]|nr:acyl-CoA dehydrogenase [Pseudonocardiaceae bacterium]
MEFVFSPEQEQLRSTVRRLLAERAPLSRNRELAEHGQRHDPQVYRDMAEQIGLQGLALPEDLGGSGGSLVDLAVVCEEQGAVLFGGPFFATAVLAAHALLACADDPTSQALLGAVADGKTTATLAVVETDGRWERDGIATRAEPLGGDHRLSGMKELVLDGAGADVLLVVARSAAGLSLFRVDPAAPGVQCRPLRTLDGTRAMARLQLTDAPARLLGEDGGGWRAVERARQVATVLLAAEQVGGARQCVELTAEHARQRRQFGRPIGSFQAVKHRLADMAARLELARAAAYWAAWQCPGTSPRCDEAVAVAGSYCGESFLQTTADTIQLHGGIGFTWEHDAHLYLRRARCDLSLLGTPQQRRERLGELVGAAEGSAR